MFDSKKEDTVFEIIRMEILDVHNRKLIPFDAIENLNVNVIKDISRGMIIELTSYIMRHKLVGDEYKVNYLYKVFSTWWDHFKYSHMPKWFVNIFPVHYTEKKGSTIVNFYRYATYPKANIKLTDHQLREKLGPEFIMEEVKAMPLHL